MNSARVRSSRRRYGRLVGVLSVSGRAAVGSRLAGAVGLGGFSSPDVLKYRLAVLGVPVIGYSDKRHLAVVDHWVYLQE